MNTRILIRLSIPIGVALIVGIATIVLLRPQPVSDALQPTLNEEAATPASVAAAAHPGPQPGAGSSTVMPDASVVAEEPEFPSPPENSERYWEERLFKLLNNDRLSDRELGQQLTVLAADSKATRPVRVDALRNALIYTDDEFYEQDIMPFALRTDLTEELNDTIYNDLVERDPALSWPVAKAIAILRQHPMAGAMADWVAQEKATEN